MQHTVANRQVNLSGRLSGGHSPPHIQQSWVKVSLITDHGITDIWNHLNKLPILT